MATKQSQSQTEQRSFDKPLWILIFALLAGAIFANHQYQHVAWALRLTAWLVLGCGLVALTLMTEKGNDWKTFFNEARIEMRKVVWPTRQVTGQMTMMVLVLVMITAVILWLMDTVFVKVIQFLTISL